MTDIDLTTLPRTKALQVCKEVFGMSDIEAQDFVALARGTVTVKATAQKRVPKGRHGGGQFAKKIGGYAGAFASGVGQSGGSALLGHHAGKIAGKRYGQLGGFVAQIGAIHAGNAASTRAGNQALKLLVGKKRQARGAALQKLGRTVGSVAYLAYTFRKPIGAAARAAARGARQGLRYRQSIRRGAQGYRHWPGGDKVVDNAKYRFAESMLTRVAEKSAKRSYNELMSSANDAFRSQFPNQPSAPGLPYSYRYIAETWPSYAVVEEDGKYFKVDYDADLNFSGRADWVEVEKQVEWATKQISATAMVFKEADGEYRWVLLSSNGYRDRDGQIISTKGLERDAALWELEGAPADPLRWWHVALDEDHKTGLELGVTDFRMVSDHTLIESGTFLTKEIGEGVYNARDQLEASVGFRHSVNEPDEDGVFENVHIFERSLLPKGHAANVLTQLLVTE